MLTPGPNMVGGSTGDVWEYLDHGKSGDRGQEYYLGNESVEERRHEAWGAGAERFGLRELDGVAFDRLARGRDPNTGQDLRVQAQNGQHKMGTDMVFSPPKSVSVGMVTATAAERDQLQAAHDAAVRAGCEVLQERAQVTRPTRDTATGRRPVREAAEVVVGLFKHHTSRPSPETAREGRPPDPQMHTHAFFFNLAWNAESGKWMAADNYGLYTARKFGEAAYTTELVHQLQARGWRMEETVHPDGKRSWELAGHDPRSNDLFSSRHRQINELAAAWEAEHGRPASAQERYHLARDDRLPKDAAGHAAEPDWETYRTILRDRGMDAHGVHPRPPGPDVRPDAVREAELVQRQAEVVRRLMAPDGLTAKDATFHRAEVPLKVYELSAGLLSKREADTLMSSPEIQRHLVRLSDRWMTTEANLDREADIVEAAERKAGESSVRPRKDQIDAALGRWKESMGGDAELSLDQRRALREMTGRGSMALVQGVAGSGKGVVMGIATDAFHQSGCTVYAVSVSGQRAIETGRRIGADEGMTIERFVGLVDAGKIRPDGATVIMLDEAVMVDTPRMNSLLAAAGDARINGVGDTAQFQAIGAGGWWRDAEQVIGQVELTTVMRQRSAVERHALNMMRTGKAAPVLQSFDRRGRVHRSSSPEWAKRDVVDAWDKHRGDVGTDEAIIVTDYPNPDIDWLNGAAQDKRRQGGELSKESLEARTKVSYGERVEQLHVGDRVMMLKGYKPENVRNGDRGVIRQLVGDRRQAIVEMGDGRQVVIPVPEGPMAQQWLRLNYAGHTMRMQGAEAERVLVLPNEKISRSIQHGYPLMTRHRGQVHLFLDRQTWAAKGKDVLEKLSEHWSHDKQKETARSRTAHRTAERRADRAYDRAAERDHERTA